MNRPAAFLKIIFIFVVALSLSGVKSVFAEDMDPLLLLLIKKGVITEAEALELQAESERAEAPPAQPAPRQAEAKTAHSWTDKIDFGGDIRLRYEGFDQKGSFDDGRRDRFRFRLRAGITAAINDWMKAGFELRTGNPDEPVSNNVTFSGGLTSKDFSLAEAYLEFRPEGRFSAVAGKFDPKKWWTVSDLQWDDDVTLEGLMTNTQLAAGHGGFKGLDLVAYGVFLSESKNGPDASLFGGQLRSGFEAGTNGSVAFGAGFDAWDRPQSLVEATVDGSLAGNKVTNFLDENGQLISDFEILNVFAQYKNTSSSRWPFKFSLVYYKNLGAEGIGAENDTAYYGRVQFGESKKPYHLEFRYTYYYSEPDALFYLYTQSDTARASDADAHRFDLRLGFIAKSSFNFTWYNTKPVYREDETLNRWQLDYIVKF